MNNKPIYVLKTVENIFVEQNAKSTAAKKIVAVFAAILLFSSFVLGENLFGELSLMARVLLLGLVATAFVKGKKEFSAYPLELHFYEDRIEIHRLHVPYSPTKIKRELHIFKYADLPSFTYGQRTKYMTIRGIAHGEWYLFEKNGVVSSVPERVRDNVKGICYFFVGDPSIDIVRIIEEFSPVKVTLENN